MLLGEAAVLYNDQEIEMPVREGKVVNWADKEGIKRALGISKFKKPIPAGYLRTSNNL